MLRPRGENTSRLWTSFDAVLVEAPRYSGSIGKRTRDETARSLVYDLYKTLRRKRGADLGSPLVTKTNILTSADGTNLAALIEDGKVVWKTKASLCPPHLDCHQRRWAGSARRFPGQRDSESIQTTRC